MFFDELLYYFSGPNNASAKCPKRSLLEIRLSELGENSKNSDDLAFWYVYLNCYGLSVRVFSLSCINYWFDLCIKAHLSLEGGSLSIILQIYMDKVHVIAKGL